MLIGEHPAKCIDEYSGLHYNHGDEFICKDEGDYTVWANADKLPVSSRCLSKDKGKVWDLMKVFFTDFSSI